MEFWDLMHELDQGRPPDLEDLEVLRASLLQAARLNLESQITELAQEEQDKDDDRRSLFIYGRSVLAMNLDLDFKNYVLDIIKTLRFSRAVVSGRCDTWPLFDLMISNDLFTAADVRATWNTIGEELGKLKSLTRLALHVFPKSVTMGTILLSHCRQVKELTFSFPSPGMTPSARQLVHLYRAIRQHPCSDCRVTCQSGSLSKVASALRSFPTHFRCIITGPDDAHNDGDSDSDDGGGGGGGGDDDDGDDEPVDYAVSITKILGSRRVRSLSLLGLVFDNAESVDEMCRAIKSCPMDSIVLDRVEVPSAMEDTVIDTITTANFSFIHYTLPNAQRRMKTFGCQINYATGLESLSVGSQRHYLSASTVVDLLEDTDRWKLKHLFIFIKEWTAELERTLAKFVKENSHIEFILVKISPEFNGPPICSKVLLEAVDYGTRNVQYMTFESETQDDTDCIVDSNWKREMEALVLLNNYRMICQSQFEGMKHANSPDERLLHFGIMIDKISLTTLYEFLRRGELNPASFASQNSEDMPKMPVSSVRTRLKRKRDHE